ncbi:MAG: helix-turn-helix transcriptional regulator [Gemmatimonadales bacterium]
MAALIAAYERRAEEADRVNATASLGPVYRAVLEDLTALTDASDHPSPIDAGDRLLNVDEAAAVLGVTPQWLYRHAKDLPFTCSLSRKCLRFSRAGILHWLKARRS